MEGEKQERNKEEEYREGIKKTVTPLLFGILAGIVSFFVALSNSNPAWDINTSLLILLLTIMVQKFVFPLLHTSIKEAKDWIYISFITFFSWFIAFSLLLNIHF
jgi:cell division protein FtsW (lipid II flippase)